MASLIVVPPPSPEARVQPMDKAEFKRLIDFRRSLLLAPPERPLSAFSAERIRAVLKSPKPTPQQLADVSKAIAAETQRRADAEAARHVLVEQVNQLIADFEREHRADALLVWEGYHKELEQLNPTVAAFEAEKKMAEDKVNNLRA
jgi:hypothetical protein